MSHYMIVYNHRRPPGEPFSYSNFALFQSREDLSADAWRFALMAAERADYIAQILQKEIVDGTDLERMAEYYRELAKYRALARGLEPSNDLLSHAGRLYPEPWQTTLILLDGPTDTAKWRVQPRPDFADAIETHTLLQWVLGYDLVIRHTTIQFTSTLPT